MKYITIILFCILFFLTNCSTPQKSANEGFKKVITETKKEISAIDTNYLDNRIREAVINGSVLEQQGRYAEAILEFQQALKYDSSSALYYAIAKNYKELEKFDLALDYGIKSIEADSLFIPGYELLADIYVLRFQIDNAIATYQHLNKLKPEKFSKLNLARLYEFRNIDTAIALYESEINDTEDLSVINRLAKLYQQKNENSKYIKLLERSFNLRPNSEVASSIVNYYLDEKDYAKAVDVLKDASRKIPPDEIDYIYGSVANEFYGDSTKNSRKYITGLIDDIEKYYYFEWRLILLGAFLAEKADDSSRAVKMFDRTLKISDSIADIPIQIGLFYLQKENRTKALEIFKSYGDKFPANGRFPLYSGMILVELDSLKPALGYIKKSIGIDSTDVDAWAQLGIIYDRMEKPDSSDHAYERALRLDSNDAMVNNNYAYSLSERDKDMDRALSMSRKALERNPKNSAYLDTYGWIQYRLGNYKDAREYITKAIEAGEPSAEVYEHLGDVNIKLDKKNEAIDAWKKSLQMEPGRESVIKKLNSIK